MGDDGQVAQVIARGGGGHGRLGWGAHSEAALSHATAGYDAGMTFNVAAEAYDRFMGRYSVHLSPQMADLAQVRTGQRVLDVGCGPGALTAELVARLGPVSVTAVDPSPPFVEAARTRNPGARVEEASAEQLPFADGEFDAALAQLVVHFMADPVAGLAEMARVTRPGGAVAACVWNNAEGRGPLSLFWQAVASIDPGARDAAALADARDGHLAELFAAAGLADISSTRLTAGIECRSFEEWWEPFSGGVGPAGAYVAGLDGDTRTELRERCRALLPAPPFTVTAQAWAARGTSLGPTS
jgi:SAM-dependent methyltransferase